MDFYLFRNYLRPIFYFSDHFNKNCHKNQTMIGGCAVQKGQFAKVQFQFNP